MRATGANAIPSVIAAISNSTSSAPKMPIGRTSPTMIAAISSTAFAPPTSARRLPSVAPRGRGRICGKGAPPPRYSSATRCIVARARSMVMSVSLDMGRT